jgi:hypothetical protein
MRRLIFGLCAKVSDEHSASIIRAEERSIGKQMVYIGRGDWPIIAME